MLQPMPKQEFLAQLQARNLHNRELVEEIFLPLNEAQRSAQPASGEWSADQCFQHLHLAFEYLSPKFIAVLDIPEPDDFDGIFRPSWFARHFMERRFDPKEKGKTLKRNSPMAVYKAETLTNWLEQQTQLEAMIARAYSADLQAMNWFLIARYTLGDFLNHLVSHDELHIDQARRALNAYEQRISGDTL